MKLPNNFLLIIMSIIFMIMGNVYTYLGQGVSSDILIWFKYLGNLSVPLFFYVIVDGFFYANSRVKYIKRLFFIGILMIGIDWILNINNNIFISLGLNMAMLSGIEYIKTQKVNSKGFRIGLISVILLGILSINTEASVQGVAMVLIFYFLRDRKMLMILAYIAVSLCPLLIKGGFDFLEIALRDTRWMMVFAIIPIAFYKNKKVSSNNLITRIFYLFYPIHLIILVTISKFIV